MPVDGLLSEPQLLWSIDLLTVTTAGLQKFSDYRFFQVDVEEEAQAHGVCLWFTCQFPALQASNIDEGCSIITMQMQNLAQFDKHFPL